MKLSLLSQTQLRPQISINKHINIAVHDCLHIAGFGAGAMVLDHGIWVEYIRTDLEIGRASCRERV